MLKVTMLTSAVLIAAVFVSVASGLPPGLSPTGTPPVTQPTNDITPFPTVPTFTPTLSPTITTTPTVAIRWTMTSPPTQAEPMEPAEPGYWPTAIPVFIPNIIIPQCMTCTYPR